MRRWTAPRAATVSIRSKLVHDAAPGDGIRAFVVSSRSGKLQSAKIHRKSVDLNVETLAVERGETIDFVVDIGDVLNSDQYLWKVAISDEAADAEAAKWDSQRDFPSNSVDRLTPWQQLAQVLLCSNEFMFID